MRFNTETVILFEAIYLLATRNQTLLLKKMTQDNRELYQKWISKKNLALKEQQYLQREYKEDYQFIQASKNSPRSILNHFAVMNKTFTCHKITIQTENKKISQRHGV
tara:strand:- start:43454 stop:43774 length:321 start_codon:yes stop_codon:yes gene_type:complete